MICVRATLALRAPHNGASSAANRHLQPTLKGESDGSKATDRIVDELEVFSIFRTVLVRVVTNDYRALFQMGANKFQRRQRDIDPDIDKHEVDGAVDLLQGVPKVTLAQLD